MLLMFSLLLFRHFFSPTYAVKYVNFKAKWIWSVDTRPRWEESLHDTVNFHHYLHNHHLHEHQCNLPVVSALLSIVLFSILFFYFTQACKVKYTLQGTQWNKVNCVLRGVHIFKTGKEVSGSRFLIEIVVSLVCYAHSVCECECVLYLSLICQWIWLTMWTVSKVHWLNST